jgi:hypothetical protein
MKNAPFNFPGTIVEIEIFADTIYYIIYGKYKTMLKFKDIMNEFCEKNKIDKKYIISKLNLPVAKLCDTQQENHNKLNKSNDNFKFDTNLESIQCMVYADCSNKDAKDMYTLLCLERNSEKDSYNIRYPSIELNENFEPEDMIYKELKKVSPAYAKYIKKNLKLIDIAGENDEILVYNCKFLDAGINKEIKDLKSKFEKKIK